MTNESKEREWWEERIEQIPHRFSPVPYPQIKEVSARGTLIVEETKNLIRRIQAEAFSRGITQGRMETLEEIGKLRKASVGMCGCLDSAYDRLESLVQGAKKGD